MKAVIQAGARRKRPMPLSAKPVLEFLRRWRRHITTCDIERLMRSLGSDSRRWGIDSPHTQELEPIGIAVRCDSRAPNSKARV